MANEKRCGQCKFIGPGAGNGRYACYASPPAAALVTSKGPLGTSVPGLMTYRPEVAKGDMSCCEFHEVFEIEGVDFQGEEP
ncbi:MAG: hypothetical protein ABW166_04975 [Sedimenticola sp.]